jgi:uncharacterized membrane protein
MDEISLSNTAPRKEKLTYFETFVDRITAFCGSKANLLMNTVSFIGWILSDTLFVLISQNRQAAKDRIKADLDYQVNVKTELEMSTMAEQIRDIEQKLHYIHHDVLEARGGRERA